MKFAIRRALAGDVEAIVAMLVETRATIEAVRVSAQLRGGGYGQRMIECVRGRIWASASTTNS